MAFTRHPATWSRKHYRGSYAADLWVMDVAGRKFSRLGGEDYKGNRMWPMYARNGEIFYVSNQLDNEKGIKFGGPDFRSVGWLGGAEGFYQSVHVNSVRPAL